LSYERMSMCFPAPLTNSSLSSTRAEKQGFNGTFLDNPLYPSFLARLPERIYWTSCAAVWKATARLFHHASAMVSKDK